MPKYKLILGLRTRANWTVEADSYEGAVEIAEDAIRNQMFETDNPDDLGSDMTLDDVDEILELT